MSDLSKIAAISGQGGLFQIVSPVKNGVVMETLDEKKTKIIAGASSKVSVLSEISVYTDTADGSVPLESVFRAFFKKYQKNLPVTSKSDAAELKKALLEVLPEVDLDRVYTSDIKKLVSWFHILVAQLPELWIEKETPAKPEKVAKAKKEEPASGEEKPKKEPKAKAKKD